MKAKITKRVVDSLEPGARTAFIWDVEIRGFGLKVTPAGRRVYLLQYRHDERLRRYTIGAHGSPWTPDAARNEARRLLGMVVAGRDPMGEKSERRQAVSVGELCELYLSEGCDTAKPSTLEKNRSLIRRHIVPLLGRRKLKSLDRADIEAFLRDVAAGKTACDVKTGFRGRARVRGGPAAANRALALLSAMLTFAVHRGVRADNPALGVRKFKIDRLDRFLSAVELSQLGEALTRAESDGLNPFAIGAIRFLTLSGCRKSEALRLHWSDVDWDNQCLRLPDSKTGAKIVSLGAPALALLNGLPRVDGNSHVFVGEKPGHHLVGLQKIWERLRVRAGLEGLRLHDLRHSYASVGAAGGDSLLIIGRLLGHATHASTQRYSHLSDDPVRSAADRISSTIAKAMSAADQGEVIPLQTQMRTEK